MDKFSVSFTDSGKLIKGQGLFAQALIKAGYKVVDAQGRNVCALLVGAVLNLA